MDKNLFSYIEWFRHVAKRDNSEFVKVVLKINVVRSEETKIKVINSNHITITLITKCRINNDNTLAFKFAFF